MRTMVVEEYVCYFVLSHVVIKLLIIDNLLYDKTEARRQFVT